MLWVRPGADAVYQLKSCMVGIMEQLESVLGAAESDSKQVRLWPICAPSLPGCGPSACPVCS